MACNNSKVIYDKKCYGVLYIVITLPLISKDTLKAFIQDVRTLERINPVGEGH